MIPNFDPIQISFKDKILNWLGSGLEEDLQHIYIRGPKNCLSFLILAINEAGTLKKRDKFSWGPPPPGSSTSTASKTWEKQKLSYYRAQNAYSIIRFWIEEDLLNLQQLKSVDDMLETLG